MEPFRNLDTILQVRIEASRALLDIEYESKGISSALSLFMKYVVEESSLRGQVKLCVHTMRLCQIAVGCGSDDCVDTVSLLELLHLFKSHVVFNNEFLRHHLFCIFQILAGRPPTLFGVPKEKPLQLVDVEACIEPKNVFSVPGAEAGGPSLLALGDAKGKSLDVAPFGVPVRSQETFMPIAPVLKFPEPVAASLHETQHIEPRMENRNQPLHENPIVHEILSDAEAPTEEVAKREANLRTKEPQKEPDVVSVSVSHEMKTVIRIKVRPSGATSRAEGSARSMERSQGIVVRHDIDRGQTSSASVDAPQRISADAHMEEVNSCHDIGSRMTASIGSVKLVSEGDTFGKELLCTAESGKTSTSQKADNNQEVAAPSFLPQDRSMGNESQQKYASLQTLSAGKEREKKKDKEKKEKKRKREDPAYVEKKRLKKEKKQKEKEMAKLLSSSSDPATKKIERVAEPKPDGPSDKPKTEPSAPSEARPSTKIRIKLKSKAFNNP